MKKKIVVFLLMICSFWGLFACGSDPYANMTMTIYYNAKEVADGQVINLDIEQTSSNFGEATVQVAVGGLDYGEDTSITISGGEGYVYTSTYYDQIAGVTSITVVPVSADRTGRFSLKVGTSVGSLSKEIAFNIDLTLENFSFKEDALKAIAKGSSVSLSNIDSFIKFYPEETTQRNLTLEVATLVENVGGAGFVVDGYGDKTFSYNDDGQEYAKIENGVLKTFDTYKDAEGVDRKISYPTWTPSATAGGSNEAEEVVILKASYYSTKYEDYIVDFLLVPVIEVYKESDVKIYMDTVNGGEEEFEIPKSENGTFDIIMVDGADMSVNDKLNNSYCFERELSFKIFDEVEDNYFSDFKITTTSTSDDNIIEIEPLNGCETDKDGVIDIYPNPDVANVKILAKKAGVYTHEFVVTHKDSRYAGLFDKTIVIKFTVKDLPDDIEISNNGRVVNDKTNPQSVTIYDYYKGAKGEKIEVKINNKVGEYKYLVLTKSDEFASDNLNLYSAKSNEKMTFASLSDGTLSSADDSKAFTLFGSNDCFYISHSFTSLSTKTAKIYVGVQVSMRADSYVDGDDCFRDIIYLQPITVNFAIGLRSFEFDSNKIYVDLTRSENLSNAQNEGTLLYELPEGQTMDSCLNLDKCRYDSNLISLVETEVGEENPCVSILIKCNNLRKEGSTIVELVARNGVTGSVTVYTYMPTIYREKSTPLAVEANKSDSGYLYSVSGASDYNDYASHNSQLVLAVGDGELSYNSIHTLFGAVSKSVRLSFYDYLDLGDNNFESYDITSKVKVSFKGVIGYASYDAGTLYFHQLVTNYEKPLEMLVTYVGGYAGVGDDGEPEYKEVTVEHTIYVYIYKSMVGIEVETQKETELYIDDGLGYFDKSLASSVASAKFSPNEDELGYVWNDDDKFGGADGAGKKLLFGYFCSMLNTEVVKDGKKVQFYPNDYLVGDVYTLKYSDLFEVYDVSKRVGTSYTCGIKCRLSEELKTWIYGNYGAGTRTEKIEQFLNNCIYGKDYTLSITISASQFGRLTNSTSISYVCKFAPKINSIKLFVNQTTLDDDGVYFDLRDVKAGVSPVVIDYVIDATACLNKKVMITGGNSAHFNVTTSYTNGNTGKITITPNADMNSGGLYDGNSALGIILEDNVSGYNSELRTYSYFKEELNQFIRVKIADGSNDFPYEIRSTGDYSKMLNEVSKGSYDYYILAKDIDVSEISNYTPIDVKEDGPVFSLNGNHTYYRNGDKVDLYNTIYNLTIKTDITTMTGDVYVGLFGIINSSVSFSNLRLENVKFEITGDTNANNIYVGGIAGEMRGARLNSVSVSGNISVQITAPNATLYVGGIVGKDTYNGDTGEVLNRAKSTNGLSSGEDNVNVGVQLSGKANEVYAGGVIGKLDHATIDTLQVVSGISSNMQAESENIGGAIGVSDSVATINNIEVSPVISISGSNKSGNYGGIVGKLAGGELTYSKAYFVNVGDVDSYLERLNIRVQGLKQANVGGVVGYIDSGASVGYTYARSFYSNDVETNVYAGNIQVIDIANKANVGGVAGLANTTGTISSSYFDGDINVSAEMVEENITTNINAGVLFGDIIGGKVSNAYAIGRLYYTLSDGSYTASTNYGYSNGIVGGATYEEKSINFNGYNGITYPLVHEFYSTATFTNVYAVVNNGPVFIAFNSIAIMGENANDLMTKIKGITVAFFQPFASLSTPLDVFELLGYKITDGVKKDASDVASNYQWFKNEKIYKIGDYNYPILLTQNGKAMYDLVPSKLGVKFNNNINNIYDISYTETDEKNNQIKHNQLIMFMKKKADGTYSGDYYEILAESVSGSENVAIQVVFDGDKIQTDLITIPFNDKIEINIASTSSSGVVELKGNRIYPLKEGVATVEIRSYLDKTVKTTFNIKVVAYLDTIELKKHTNDSVEKVEYSNDSSRTVYVDEVSNFEIEASSVGGYVATKDIGYILELQDSDKANGSIKIGETKYSYDENGNNVYMLSGDSVLSVVGETKGFIKLKLTPYIKLGTTKYVDNYTGVSTLENIFILNKLGMSVSRTYELKVLSRAIATSTSMPEISIAYNGGVSLNASVETSNVVLVKGEDDKENYTILEDVLFSVTKSSENIGFDEERKTYIFADLEGISDYGNVLGRKYYFASPYHFEHKLIILEISAFTIERTTINPENKEHTYRITLDMTISFNADFYRLNASSSEYDLNSIKFRTDVVPESNLNYANGNPYEIINKNIVGQTTIAITPIGLTDIFLNYYSRGEGLLENTENTYPNDNESFRIVPGRDGLLKITLNEEFSNSSYVTVTLDNKYGGYVRIEQMAGVLESVDDGIDVASQFNTYEELRYNEPFNGDTYYGIKLQKLSCNLATQTYFDGTYYVKVTLQDGVNYDSIFGVDGKVEIVVTSYTIDNFGKISETLPEPKVKELTITPLPSLSVQVGGSKNIFMGVGTKKALTINYSHLSNNLGYTVTPIDDANVYIIDDAGEKVNTLSLEYIDAGRTYYIAMDVSTDRGTVFTLEVFGQEYIEGILETTRSQIVITAVEYEVTDVSLAYSTYDEVNKETILSILHGESKILKLNMSYADIVIGEKSAIEEYKNKLDTYFKKGDSLDKFSPKQKVEYSLAGTSVTIDYGNNIEKNFVSECLGLYRIFYVAGQKTFEQVSDVGLIGGIEILKDSYSEFLSDGSTISVMYTLIRGMSISSDTNLRISVPYYYSSNGEVCAGVPEDGTYFDKYIEFKVVINENSTEDHPTPIENQADLEKYAGLSGHYILLNNIELVGWNPIPATFDSLDGNGYRIIVKSFNMSGIRSNDTVNAGIFTEISQTTLIKNLTIDVGYLLVDAITMNNDIKVVQNSNASSYLHDQVGKIDLAFVKTLNFGVLAGTNNGSLTNIKVVNSVVDTRVSDVDNPTSKYLHIITSLIDEENNATTSNIGGIVGINSETGAISNSFVGVNISEQTENNYYIKTVISPNTIEYNNEKDEMESLEIYPFVLSGSNKLAGIALENNGIISNTYTKGLGLYNASPNEENSVTSGLVGVNSNKITSSFAEGAQIKDYRDTGVNDITIEAIGNVAGLVYTNSGLIENAYANVYLQTNSSSIAGFVFTNSGTINSSYSTSINRNNLAYGPFTGIVNRVAQNTGTYSNCFYLVGEDEEYNDFEVATPMYAKYFAESESMSLQDFWTGFSFVSAPEQNTDDGIWTIVDGLPTIATTQIDTNSFRALTDATEERDDEGIIKYSLYSYVYGSAYQEGSMGNPLIIASADNFAPRIIAKSKNIGTNANPDIVFGGSSVNDLIGQLSAIEYVRLVNNLEFKDIMVSNQSDGYSLYEVTFAGKLDGNGMSMNNLKISTEKSQLENFGLFKQIGSTKTTAQSVIKNLDINLIGFTSSNNNKVGVLAGTIINASIANVNINGNSQVITAVNMAGGLAGLIYAYGDNSVSIVDVEVSDISVQASHVSIGGTIEDIDNSKSLDLSYGRYQTFRIINTNTSKEDQGLFTHLKTETTNGVLRISNTSEISYAGAVAGAVIANNCDELSELSDSERLDENSYRSTTTPSIYNILVKGNITVGGADYAGGLFGYLGENSRIKNSKFELSDGQTIVGRNFAGGIVAENHGIIEQCFVAYADDVQTTYDQTIGAEGTNRSNGMASLFNYDTTHTVAIGGIAGYSNNGAIVDSFSKVNVVDENAFIAGGILGYSYLYNYIGYSYTTGAVYGRDVMGGVVGLQISENNKITEKLYFDTVVGLNNWDNNREEISGILYSGYKNLYLDPVTSKYYSFYLKMSEVGNQELYLPTELMDYYNIDTTAVRNVLLNGVTLEEGQTENGYLSDKLDIELSDVSSDVKDYINSLSGTDEEILEGKLKAYYYANNIASINDSYKSAKKVLENRKFVGSVVGASYIFESSIPDEISDNNALILSNSSDKMGEIYNSNTIKHTFSNTYGIYQNQSGSLENGNKNDTYLNGTFSFAVGSSSVSSYSYRVSYISEAEEGEEYYNDYAKDGVTTPSDIRFNFSSTSKYMDKLNFAKVFTSQEYTEQLIGTFYRTETAGVMKSTYNVFMAYDKKRYDIPSTGNDTFVSRDGTQSIWSVKDADNDYLPFINDGSIVAVEHLYAGNADDVETLKSIFISNAGNATYYLHTGIKTGTSGKADATAFEIDVEDSTSISFTSTLRSVFIGQNSPQIVFNIKSSTISTIFNSINSAVFKDIDFVINIESNNLANSDKEFNSFGVLANTVQNSLFERCKFTIDYKYSGEVATFGVNDVLKTYVAQNNGLFFGMISNSTIKDGEVQYSGISSVNLNHSNIENFGLFAGFAYYSTISNITFDFGGNTAININDVASTANIGLIGYLQGSNYLCNDVKNEACIQINQNDKVSIYVSPSIGYAYNSVVNLKNVTKFMRMIYDTNVSNANAYLGAVAGGSQGSRFRDIKLSLGTSNDEINTKGDGVLGEMVVGAIVGIDSASVFGLTSGTSLVGNTTKISVSSKAKTLYVGGLIGKTTGQTQVYNAYNTGEVNVTNNHVGDDKNIVNTYLGGMIGGATGSFTMSSILSSGDVVINGVDGINMYTCFALGGVAGYMSYSCNISNFTVIADIVAKKESGSGKFADEVGLSYASQVVGLNAGSFSASNGYTYSEFVDIPSEFTTSAITNNGINSAQNVFYAREFAGNNYTSDSKFMAYAYADIYAEINDNSELYNLVRNNILKGALKVVLNGNKSLCNVVLPVADTLKNIEIVKNSDAVSVSAGYSRFYLYEVNSNPENGYSDANYVAITSDVVINHIETLGLGKHISGRSTTDGKVIVTLGYSYNDKNYGNLVGTNKGVISNIYLRSSKEYGGIVYPLNVSLVGTNNGLITGVYVYERTQSQFGIANINNGTICGSATATVLYETSGTDIYGLVNENNGLIADCYSSSVGYWENATKKGQVYMVNKNSGTIINSFYYIPEVISHFNTQVSMYKEKDSKGVISNCYSNQYPQTLLNRSTIWTTENDHLQLKGIKDIENAMVVHLYYGLNFGTQNEILSIEMVKTGMMANRSKKFVFTWKIHFYEDEADVPKYNVVTIFNGSALTNYIDSLKDSTIPNMTIVAVFGTINVSSLPEFSLDRQAMFIGVYESIDDNVTITFQSKFNHALISSNAGVIANLKFERLTIDYALHDSPFAPIGSNSGVISNIVFNKLTISALGVECVSGVLGLNTGYMFNVTLSNINLNSNYYVVDFIHANKGSAGNCTLSGTYENNNRWHYNGKGAYNG